MAVNKKPMTTRAKKAAAVKKQAPARGKTGASSSTAKSSAKPANTVDKNRVSKKPVARAPKGKATGAGSKQIPYPSSPQQGIGTGGSLNY